MVRPLIGIRVDGDAGAEAGMGHVYRAVAYARRLQRELPGIALRFYMRDFAEGLRKVREEGFPVSVLPPRPSCADLGQVFADHSPTLLIVDTLGITTDLIQVARITSKVIITIDDLEACAQETDAIVNGILWGTRLLPEPFGNAQVYQGIDYIQLREQFAEANQRARAIPASVSNILISTGGADGRHFATQLMEAARYLPFPCSVSLMAGPAYLNVAELRASAARASSSTVEFSIVENASDMANYLCRADLALITGGTVMFEAAACGTPAVITCSYEHQVPQAEWFAQQGAALNLGYFSDKLDAARLRQSIELLAGDRAAREEMSIRGRNLVDSKGIDRFVEIVKKFLCELSS